MKAKVITILGNEDSESAADRCIESAKRSGLTVEKFYGIVPETVENTMREWGIEWNYPWNGHQILDMQTGILKTGYQTLVKNKRIACFLSHYSLWKECASGDEDYVILEHDAHFEKKLPIFELEKSNKTIIALNKPQPGCTPRADFYAQQLRHQIPQGSNNVSPARVLQIPYISDDQRHPAGLPGNSAYYMKPSGAKKMLRLVKEYGAWPNDAIMCKQMLPGDLGIIWPNVTRVNRGVSTTTL